MIFRICDLWGEIEQYGPILTDLFEGCPSLLENQALVKPANIW